LAIPRLHKSTYGEEKGCGVMIFQSITKYPCESLFTFPVHTELVEVLAVNGSTGSP